MSRITVYGIPNCDTIKKTLDWFKKRDIAIAFHDYRKSGIDKKQLKQWCRLAGWETLLNRKSATWRGLTTEAQEKINNEATAVQLMQEQPTLIKRPVIVFGTQLVAGYNEEAFLNHLK